MGQDEPGARYRQADGEQQQRRGAAVRAGAAGMPAPRARVNRGPRRRSARVSHSTSLRTSPEAPSYVTTSIADFLVISPKTVESHRANLLQKLGLKDRLELTRYAIRVGLIEP